jgi:ABC-type phosphate/phosphonate transport system substrate-binding protein
VSGGNSVSGDGLLLGAVAYDPKVVTIWDGFRTWLRERALDFDYVLYSHYERQVEDLVAGRIDLAWNSPLAWVRARRLAAARDVTLTPVTMRDTDRDLRSLIVTRADTQVRTLADLRGKTVATGAVDSPQATLLPLSLLRAAGLRPGRGAPGERSGSGDVTIRRFDVGVGLHGDHIGGERDAARALMAGEADAACLIDANLLLFAREGVLPSGAVQILARTDPYDHCTLTAGPSAGEDATKRFADLLLGMDYGDDRLRPLLDLEGLKQWRPPRLTGYQQLERAVDESGFYDAGGSIGASDYRP